MSIPHLLPLGDFKKNLTQITDPKQPEISPDLGLFIFYFP
ncbi:hypothetical protein POREN0001_1870 [Porphyromonas endodontalis ATCC 35406]|uniref:Uncharacterized protein n=1 Tax=Porphyromonas endodontalis (strain ATCC 35406 / DSM 24491 / JCM 8526 / CCUG 16442 / BCRC 14492 / NCTC 13058 / HG 370) TaxID=553175 RepID=C3JBY2_POREA|nr:hypothetical protein POREN0001_1870 [Porphyromonas endodontalis ATCC 35406]